MASGSRGKLSYANGCLYLEENGGRTGLVMPSDARFDGNRLTSKNLDTRLGKYLHMSGAANPSLWITGPDGVTREFTLAEREYFEGMNADDLGCGPAKGWTEKIARSPVGNNAGNPSTMGIQ